MITEVEAFQKHICIACELPIQPLTQLEVIKYNKTALCPDCWLDSVKTEKRLERIPVQVPLPLIGNMPAILRLPPITFGQIVLYRNDLLADCMIRVETIDSKGNCSFTIIAPDEDTSNRIAKFIQGDNNA